MNLSYLAAALAGSLVLGNSLVNILASETMELVPEPKSPEQYLYPDEMISHSITQSLANEFSEYLMELYTSIPRCAMLSNDDVMDLISKPDFTTSAATYYGTCTSPRGTYVTVMGVLTEHGPAFISVWATAPNKHVIEYHLPDVKVLDDFYIWDTPEWTIESLKRITNQILQINTAA